MERSPEWNVERVNDAIKPLVGSEGEACRGGANNNGIIVMSEAAERPVYWRGANEYAL